MITITASQGAVMALTDRKILAKIEIQDSDSVWRNICDLEDYDFFNGGSVQNSVDQAIIRADLNFASFVENLYLSPAIQSSKLNKNAAGSFSALVNLKSPIKIYIAVVPQEIEPETGDYVEVFSGKIAQITPDFTFGQEEIRTFSRDLGGDLQDNFIRTSTTYSSTASETTIQSILTNNRTGVTLYTPVSPSWFTKEYAQQREPVMMAINNIAKQRGWSVRYKWDSGTSAWRLTYYEPDRTKSVADYTFGPDEYFAIPSIKYDITLIRTIVRIVYVDPSINTEQAAEYPENGGASAGGASTLTDSTKAWTVNEWTGYELWITDGTGEGQHETIASNTDIQITVDTPWVAQPDVTSRYAIVNTADSAQSLIDYGELFMEIAHDKNDQIDSKAEAFYMARAIYNDLSRPSVEMEVELFDLFPWVELGDLYTFEANEDAFDTDQTLAVVGYRHEFVRSGRDKTVFQLRGKPAGAFKQWLVMESHPVLSSPNDFPATPTIASSTTGTEIVEAQTLSYITVNLTPNVEPDFDHYTARFKRTDLIDYSFIGPVANSTAPSIKIPGLAGNSTYSVGVQAVSRRGRASDWAIDSVVAASDIVAPPKFNLNYTESKKGIVFTLYST